MSVGDFYVCPNCGGKQGFHNWPCSGSFGIGGAKFEQLPPVDTGCKPAPTLTERDVQRIVLETLDRVFTHNYLTGGTPTKYEIRDAIAAVRKEFGL